MKKYVATLRSHYSFEQFEKVLQNIAYKAAIIQVTNLQGGRIDLGDGRIREISAPDLHITFGSVIRYSAHYGKSERLAFDIEEKMYTNSNHKTKISFNVYIGGRWDKETKSYVETENKAEKERKMAEKIQAFIDKLMAEHGQKVTPRFDLKTEVVKRQSGQTKITVREPVASIGEEKNAIQ